MIRQADLVVVGSDEGRRRLMPLARRLHDSSTTVDASRGERLGDRWPELDRAVRATFARVSIVIVTGDRLPFTRLCLASLLAHTEYPNYELIVVDNGSADDTAAYLRELAAHHAYVRVTLNERDLGFAAGSNLGLGQADGVVLVLLHDDTVVPRGWLTRLVRHLEDPAVGLVGPVTNRVGNEARIAAPYRTVAGFARFARRRAQEHTGQHGEIPMLATFCVALRREVCSQVGLFDERYDIERFVAEDYTLRVRAAGYRVVCAQDVFLHHADHESLDPLKEPGTFGRQLAVDRRRFEARWGISWEPPLPPEPPPPPQRRSIAAQELPAATGYDLICFPVIEWELRFQRPQQLLTRFAHAGHRVFYLRTKLHQDGDEVQLEEIAENVYGVRLPGSRRVNLYRHQLDAAALTQSLFALDELRHRAGIHEAVMLIQLPFWAPLALTARQRWGWKAVYDSLDELSGFKGMRADMLAAEPALIADSELVVATSRLLYDRLAAHGRAPLLLPNATDFDHFHQPGPERPLAALPRPIVGYYGAISHWFDVELVRAAAIARPDWQFVLIGGTSGADVSPLASLANIHLLGEQPYAALPGYLADFDVACIPFLIEPLTLAVNPVKFYEYLSAGKPVVAVDLPELAPYADLHYPVRSPEKFVSRIETALAERSSALAAARIALARRHTWTERVRTLSGAMASLYGKVAIVVTSFDSLACLRLCLESIWTKTSYPNFEVIVVDNGSRQDVIDYLTTSAQSEPRLRLVLNGANLGFARANNVGIAEAGECAYIVLLNDDTIVTRGWLHRLVRYLDEPDVGLVGPVSNWAGNEAKIDVTYQDLTELDRFAAEYTRRHENVSFDIAVLAMYCVALRRTLLEQVGPLDERFGVGMFEDDDYAQRVRAAGYRVICAEDVFVHHWGRVAFRRMTQADYDRLFDENRAKYEDKWGVTWQPHRFRGR